MKIIIYTITDCLFSKQEKDYLTSHNLQFDEKNMETNKDFLTEMLAVSNNFSGTPVTKIEKDDGQIAVLKGFTKKEFDKTLGFEEKPAEAASTIQTPTPLSPSISPKPVEPVIKPEMPTVPPPPIPPLVEPPKTEEPKPVEPMTNQAPTGILTPPTPPPVDEKMNSILDNLQSKANEDIGTTTASNIAAPPAVEIPSIPDFNPGK